MAQSGPARTEAFRRQSSLWLHTGTCPELHGAWGRRWQVTEGSGAAATTALASAPPHHGQKQGRSPKAGQASTQAVNPRCNIFLLAPQGFPCNTHAG